MVVDCKVDFLFCSNILRMATMLLNFLSLLQNWACPPCRNVCICSVHMISRGMRPAGTLTPVARRKGYKCVLDYLVEEKILQMDENGIVED